MSHFPGCIISLHRLAPPPTKGATSVPRPLYPCAQVFIFSKKLQSGCPSDLLKKMGSIQRQDSFDENGDLINLADDVVLEAPTLTSEEMERARREALEILRNNSPEEAFRIFTQGLTGQEVQSPVVGNASTNQAVANVPPPKAGDGKTAPPPPSS